MSSDCRFCGDDMDGHPIGPCRQELVLELADRIAQHQIDIAEYESMDRRVSRLEQRAEEATLPRYHA